MNFRTSCWEVWVDFHGVIHILPRFSTTTGSAHPPDDSKFCLGLQHK